MPEREWVWMMRPTLLTIALVAAVALYRRGGEINQMAAAFVVLVLAFGLLADGLRWLARRRRRMS